MIEPENTKLPNQVPPSGDPQRSRRGGRREGAGAPRGNTNALRSGRYSPRVRALEGLLEDFSACACLIGSFAGPQQEELRRLAFVLQGDAHALLYELRGPVLSWSKGVTGPRPEPVEGRRGLS